MKAFIKSIIPTRILNIIRKILNRLRHKKTSASYDVWIKNSKERSKECKKLDYEPLISILVPLYNTDKSLLCEMIESCLNQTYKNIELCLADASDDAHSYVYNVAKTYADKDSRVKLEKLSENLGISGNTNKCRELASGEYITLLDHDDLLIEHAIYSMAKAINEGADFVYTDESNLDNGPATYNADDFLNNAEGIDYLFNEHNTTIQIQNGMAVAMTRIYTP